MAKIRLMPKPDEPRAVDDKQLRVFKVSYAGKRGAFGRPRLTITADWLERAGFHTGQVVVVAISKGRIVLRAVSKDVVDDLLQ